MAGLREMVLLKQTEAQASVPSGETSETKVDGDYFSSYDDVEVHRLMIRDKARTDACYLCFHLFTATVFCLKPTVPFVLVSMN